MKLFIFYLFCSIGLLRAADSYAQNATITLHVHEVTVADVLKQIEDISDFDFFYNNRHVDLKRQVSVSAEKSSIFKILDEVFAGTDVHYKVIDRKIILSTEIEPLQQGWGGINIHGRVFDQNGNPVIGATVMESGTTHGAITDVDGNFVLSVASDKARIEVSYIGYITKHLKVTPGEKMLVRLQEDNLLLQEVTIVGYGVQKKVNLTGSVASIDYAGQVDKRPIINIGNSLAGLSAGLQVMQGSGQPGADNATIRIRGNGTLNSNVPLVLVDGMECDLGDVNPNDIASISILKDAGSSAIYGSRGANGVILVTTKTGSEDKVSVNYSYSGIVQNAYNNLSFVSDYSRYMSLVNEACDNIGRARIFSDDNIEIWANAARNPNGLAENGLLNYMAYPNTDWFDEIYDTGFSQEHNLTISGGSKKVKYLVSAGYLDNRGIINRFGLDSGIKKFNFRTNLEAKPFKWLRVGTRLFGQKLEKGMANISNGYKQLFLATPGIYVGQPDKWGVPANAAEESIGANNILRSMYGSVGDDSSFKFNGTIYGAITPLPGLSIEGSANFVPTFGDRSSYGRPNGGWNYLTNERNSASDLSNAQITNTSSKSMFINTEVLVRYNTDFNDSAHDFGILLGYTTSHYESENFNVKKQGATDWALTELSTYETLVGSGSSFGEWALRSYFGRVNYAFKDRYLLEANLRIDGSSRFSSGNRFGYFPSFSAGWRISEEKFMKGVNFLSNLKIRVSWGKTGNNASGNYDWQALYAPANVVVGTPTKGLIQTKVANKNLQWETTTTTNLGIDFGLSSNKLSGSIDVYNKFTDGILFTPTPYLTMGTIGGATQNIAQVRNRGLELSLSYADKIGEDFSYSVTTNWGFNMNKVLKYKGELNEYWTYGENGEKLAYISNKGEVTQGGFGGLICEGHSIGEFSVRRVYKGSGSGYSGGTVNPNAGPADGMIRTEADMDWVKAMMAAGYKFCGISSVGKDKLWYGDLLYDDYNGDGNYGDSNDMHFNGHTTTPKVNGGLNVSMAWKGLDFSMLWTGAFGFYLNWNSGYNRAGANHGQAIMEHVADNHYFYDPELPDDSRTNIHGKYPRFTFGTSYNNASTSDFYEYRGDYVKLKNVQIGYTIPEWLTTKVLLNKLRAFVSMDNILTITNYPGQDPEIGADIKYPLMKQISFGIQASF